jgi:putative transposase
MFTQTVRSIEKADGVSRAVEGKAADGAGRRLTETVDGLSLDLLDALTLLAKDKVREGGLKLVGEDGLLPLITQHLMQAALEAELEEHLAAEAQRTGRRGSRSGGNARNGYRAKKVITEVGPITLQIPRDRLGTFRPRILPAHARRTGALDEMVLSLTARGMTSGEIVAHLDEVYGMKTSKETISTITDKALESMNEWRTRPLDPAQFLPVAATR